MNADSRFAETAVLGSVLRTHGVALDDLALTGADFADARDGEFYDTMRRMHLEGRGIDEVTVIDELTQAKTLERVGQGAPRIWGLADEVPTAANVAYYAAIVAEAGVRRRAGMFAAKLAQSAEGHGEIAEFRERARRDLDVALGVTERPVRMLAETLGSTIDAMDRPVRQVPSPWSALNSIIGGFRPGGLYVIGARPGIGKTAIALQAATRLATEGAVAFCTLEMPERELHLRAMAQGTGITLAHLMSPADMSLNERAHLARWRSESSIQIAFDDRASMTVFDVRQFARSVHRRTPLAGVVVDYLQLMTDDRDIPRHEKVGEMSRQLKVLARDLDVPVIALSQLNRGSESRSDKMPMMSDLRESGTIEQDADVVILLHRERDPQAADEELSMIVAKNRQGASKIARVEWQGAYVRAVNRGWMPTPIEPDPSSIPIEGIAS